MRVALTGLGTGLAMALLSACGGSSFAEESATTITDAAEKDMKALSSLRMAGSLTNDGQEISIDVALSTAGDCTGDLTLDGDAGLELLSIDGQTWIKPSEAFWEQFAGPAAAQITEAAGDKWVTFPGDEADDFAEICDLDSLLDEFNEDDSDEGVEVGETEEIDGQEAVIVNSTSDEGDPVKAWIATEEPHHILQLEVDQGDEPGQIQFSDFDAELDLEAPADDEVFDLSQLGATP